MDEIKSYDLRTLIKDLQIVATLTPKGKSARVTISDYEQCRQISSRFRISLDEETGDVSIDCDPNQIP